MKVNIPWTRYKEIFLNNVYDGHWIITKDNDLVYLPQPDFQSDYEIKERFFFVCLIPHYTSDWLKSFCEKHHPEINFDRELETQKPGVFVRYHEKFGYDYVKVVQQEKYNKLKEALGKKGYELPWE
jgi:hypothetical protein